MRILRSQILGYTNWIPLALSGLLIGLGGCDKVSPAVKPAATDAAPSGPTEQKLEGDVAVYRKDGPGGLFKNLKWYQYDMLTHIIWPFHDVFAMKTPARTYLVQIQNYYADEALTAGTFKIGVRAINTGATNQTAAAPTTYLLDGRGCGNPYTNLNFEACTKDPEQNIFAYLDLDSGKVSKMSDVDAAKDPDWDIAVRGTEIRLNSGPGFKGTVQGALAQRFAFYFSDGTNPDVAKLRQPDLKQTALAGFAELAPKLHYDFYLPEGIDRVVHESFWMSEDKAGHRTATGRRSWIIRGKDGASFSKLQIPLIEDDQRGGGGFDSRVHIRYQLQKAGEASFGAETQELVLDLSTQTKLKTLCLRLAKVEVMECSNAGGDWDLKFTAIHRLKDGRWDREWLVFTANGAIGPLSSAEAETWVSGR